MTTIYIKNMVCDRCIMVVRSELQKLNLEAESITLGVVTFQQEISNSKLDSIKQNITPLGFELIDDKRIRLVESIKKLIIEQIHYTENENWSKNKLSEYLSDKLNYEYTYLSSLFSEIENTTIEKYYIAQKIEKAKELLVYDEVSLNEIADRLGYSSAAYLSLQFKKVTNLTPSNFKNKRK